jgi:hypothetical protein
MKRLATLVLGLAVITVGQAAAEEWKNVAVVDTHCLAKVKADPDKHTAACALQCVKGGYGLLTADGVFLKFDAAGDEKAQAALKATKKSDHLRATVIGVRNGDALEVSALTLD